MFNGKKNFGVAKVRKKSSKGGGGVEVGLTVPAFPFPQTPHTSNFDHHESYTKVVFFFFFFSFLKCFFKVLFFPFASEIMVKQPWVGTRTICLERIILFRTGCGKSFD